jgi:hypothetical protein
MPSALCLSIPTNMFPSMSAPASVKMLSAPHPLSVPYVFLDGLTTKYHQQQAMNKFTILIYIVNAPSLMAMAKPPFCTHRHTYRWHHLRLVASCTIIASWLSITLMAFTAPPGCHRLVGHQPAAVSRRHLSAHLTALTPAMLCVGEQQTQGMLDSIIQHAQWHKIRLGFTRAWHTQECSDLYISSFYIHLRSGDQQSTWLTDGGLPGWCPMLVATTHPCTVIHTAGASGSSCSGN